MYKRQLAAFTRIRAGLAQLVEHIIRNDGVAGSIPAAGTMRETQIHTLCRIRSPDTPIAVATNSAALPSLTATRHSLDEICVLKHIMPRAAKLSTKHALLGSMVAAALFTAAAPALCGPPDDAALAYQRGDYAAAFNDFRALAEKGDAHAQFMLGRMYHDGQGISPDEKAAFEWFRKAAEQGNADAENYVGYMYTNGQGVREDKAAGFDWLHKSAVQGNATAQYRIGIAYVDGKATAQDDARAVTWFRKAAEQGNADAQFWLGLSYDQAEGVPQDYSAAVLWYRKSADRGNGMAQYALGLMYYKGHGVALDLVQAHRWFTLAAEREGDLRADAAEMRNQAASEMTPAQIATAQKLALEWTPTGETPTANLRPKK